MKIKKDKNINVHLIELVQDYANKGNSYIDSIIEVGEVLGMEVCEITELLSEEMLDKVKVEFSTKNMINKRKLRHSEIPNSEADEI